jgi:hypothetical protein
MQQLKVRLYFHSRFHDLISPKILPKDKRTRKGKVMRNYSRILFQFFLVSLFMPSFKRKTKAKQTETQIQKKLIPRRKWVKRSFLFLKFYLSNLKIENCLIILHQDQQ